MGSCRGRRLSASTPLAWSPGARIAAPGRETLRGILSGEPPTKTQIDRLGDRLRSGAPSDEDLILLDRFRRSYSVGYESVIATIRRELGVNPTGRPAKSTRSIIEKLRRETIRLSQMQDIAGCRFIVSDSTEQERAVAALRATLPEVHVDDRRRKPSHGYRAVHVIAVSDSKPIEVQVRTLLQHTWAEWSEKYSDVVDPEIKYGGGPEDIRHLLFESSQLVAMLEQMELEPGRMDHQALEELKRRTRGLMQSEIARLLHSKERGVP